MTLEIRREHLAPFEATAVLRASSSSLPRPRLQPCGPHSRPSALPSSPRSGRPRVIGSQESLSLLPVSCPLFINRQRPRGASVCAGGDLQGRIDAAVPSCSRRAVELMPATTFGWIVGIANAAAYFHLHGVIHRDLKPANILLASQTGTAKDVRVCDFGSARILHRHRGQDDVTTKPTGTRHYMAPEVTRQEAYDTSADIWSIGAIFLHLLTLRKPSPTALFRGDPLPVLPLLEHAGAHECLHAMLQVAPQRRPSPAVIVERLKRGTACSMCTHGDAGAHVEEGSSNIDVQLSRSYGDGSMGAKEGRAGRGDEMDEQASSGPPCACRVQ